MRFIKLFQLEYIGITSHDFKARFRNHKASLKKGKDSPLAICGENGLNRNIRNEYAHPGLKWEILK